ncbi:MAG TPA: ATP-binding protein, partial [Candidatus Limnocylindria bacterium]|nr:ATP-binding protein [Candidatus Limnocylindria bacterium]
MQQLISDLLSLSRLSRAEMKMERVDLSQIVALIARELQNLHPTRTDVDFKIEPDVFVFGDAALLRIALENLLGNAWKFTGQRKGVVIEFGARRDQGTPVFFVRDNGAGFDMTYASKLFAPFQRLHTSHEFPGSGIGLATVQRIIRRHEGEVWAEGKRGEGATVYFRLQKERVASVSESPRPGETKASASIASKNSPAPLVPA